LKKEGTKQFLEKNNCIFLYEIKIYINLDDENEK